MTVAVTCACCSSLVHIEPQDGGSAPSRARRLVQPLGDQKGRVLVGVWMGRLPRGHFTLCVAHALNPCCGRPGGLY